MAASSSRSPLVPLTIECMVSSTWGLVCRFWKACSPRRVLPWNSSSTFFKSRGCSASWLGRTGWLWQHFHCLRLAVRSRGGIDVVCRRLDLKSPSRVVLCRWQWHLSRASRGHTFDRSPCFASGSHNPCMLTASLWTLWVWHSHWSG